MSRRILLLPSLLIPLAATGCGESTRAAADAPAERPPINVSVEKLEPQSLTETLELSGELRPWTEVEVASELGGRVVEVGFREGERVEQGRVLARVGTDLLEAALREATAVRTGAEAAHTKTEKLFERQAVPRQELVAATAQFEQAKALEDQARLRLERSIVRAPISGVAISRLVEPGEVLSPGARITTLHRVDRLKAVAGIPESDVGAFHEQGQASLAVDAWPGESFEGRIHLISPTADEKTRTFSVEVAIDNAGGRLRPGMIGRVSLLRQQLHDAVVVSRDVLQERDDGTVAVVLEGDVARVRPVRLGASQGTRVEVVEGLAAGEWLIVKGQRGLVEGQKVAVVERSGS